MNVKFTFGFLCYNTMDISIECFQAIVAEAERLYPLVRGLYLAVVDNGTDGTGKACIASLDRAKMPFDHIALISDGINYGQGAARNRIVTAFPSDYIMFVDGDIRITPGCAYPMLSYMMARPRLGCLSPSPHDQTTDPNRVKPLESIEPVRNRIASACTGYALYRTMPFRQGIRFEDSGPFYGPGWGLEDDDMYLQLLQDGWEVVYFKGMTYLQRKPRSSWPVLKENGVDIVKKFDDRKEFFLRKWETKGVDPAILNQIKGQNLRGLADA